MSPHHLNKGINDFTVTVSNNNSNNNVVNKKNTDYVQTKNHELKIIDIRTSIYSNTTENLQQQIWSSLCRKSIIKPKEFNDEHPISNGEQGNENEKIRSIPTLVLYDDRGLELFDQITYLDEYYLTRAEIQLFETHGQSMVSDFVPERAVMIELGVGSMRKTKYFLECLVKQKKQITYYALDLSEKSLKHSLQEMQTLFPQVKFVGLLGTYDDSIDYIKSHIHEGPKIWIWIGSSIGNLHRHQAASFLTKVRKTMAEEDLFLCGIDKRNSFQDVKLAYDDPKGITREFILNGLNHVNDIFSPFKNNLSHLVDRNFKPIFDVSQFEYLSIYNEREGRHESYYKSLNEQTIVKPLTSPSQEIKLNKEELIHVEYSYKYSMEEVEQLIKSSDMKVLKTWTDHSDRYCVHLFGSNHNENDLLAFQRNQQKESSTIPTSEEFNQLWSTWDHFSLNVIPRDSILEKPISWRHCFLFYIGHLPAFMDIQISKAFGLPLMEPVSFAEIFERGIDPDMDDPQKCNPHSKVPEKAEEWPTLSKVIEYRDRVRARALQWLQSLETFKGTKEKEEQLFNHGMNDERIVITKNWTTRQARTFWMCYEHDGMHLETFLYMLVQHSSLEKPVSPIALIEDDDKNKITCKNQSQPTPITRIKAGSITFGLNDDEQDDENRIFKDNEPITNIFGWDNEKPKRTLNVEKAFEIQNRTVTNSEFYKFWLESQSHGNQKLDLIASWYSLRDADGHYSTDIDSIYVRTVDGLVPLKHAWNWPVYVSYDMAFLYSSYIGMRLPTEAEWRLAREHFLSDSDELINSVGNYGFLFSHPISVSNIKQSNASINSRSEQLDMNVGNGWEWTSSVWATYGGFKASKLYPGYSLDFFDGKHNVLLGASWATVPRIAERKSFRNWYQSSYPYVFSTFRCVKS